MAALTLFHVRKFSRCFRAVFSSSFQYYAVYSPRFSSGYRTFLSAAYACDDVWNERFSEPAIKEIKPATYYVELDRRFSASNAISAIDFDLFANSIVRDDDSLDDLEDVVNRFRRSPNTVHLLPSTTHAVVRSYLQSGQYASLMRILNGTVDYGIFPDHYLCNLIMDTFIRKQNFRDASKIAILMMLQEDFEHPISHLLALYSCLCYLRNPQPQPWNTEPPPAPPEDPPEQIIIRLPFLPPNYFDDHFDLKDAEKLLGKTLCMLARKHLDTSLGRTCLLLGTVMYEKCDKAEKLANEILNDRQASVYKEGIQRALKAIEEKKEKSENEDSRVALENLLPLLNRLETAAVGVESDILDDVKETIEAAVRTHERTDIQQQSALYRKWATVRVSELQKQADAEDRAKRLKRIEEIKADLRKREELLFFFENFEIHAMNVDKYEAVAKEVEAAKHKQGDEVYIPPDVTYKPKQKV